MLGRSLPESAIDSFPGSLKFVMTASSPTSCIAINAQRHIVWICDAFVLPSGLHISGYRLSSGFVFCLSDLNTLNCLPRGHRRFLEHLLIYKVHMYLLFSRRYVRDIRTKDTPRHENL